MKLLKVFIVICVACYFGCAVSNPNELRQNHKGKISFTVNSGYQEVFRKIVEHEEMPMHETHSQIYTDLRSGKIYLRRAVTPFDSFVLIDVAFVNDKLTTVDYYYYFSAWESLGLKLKDLLTKEQ